VPGNDDDWTFNTLLHHLEMLLGERDLRLPATL
jgi:hypothetical protein